jgi:hypothetical protein
MSAGTVLTLADSAHTPTVAATPEGAVYTAWAETDSSGTNIYLSTVSEGGASPPVRVNNVPGDAAYHAQAPPEVAVGPGGEVYVAWIVQTPIEGRIFPASDLRLARSNDGGRTFEPAITVNDDPGFPTGHHFHNLAVGPDGTVYVSWLDSRESDRAAMQQSAQHGTAAAMPGHNHTGEEAHAHHESEAGTQVRVARSTDGGRTFATGVIVDSTSCQCCRTTLAIGEDNTVYVAWRKIYDGDIRDMAMARSIDGGQTFSPPVRIYEDNWQINGCPHSGPALAVDDERRVHVAWYTGAEGRMGVYYTVLTPEGERLREPVLLTSGTQTPVSQVKLAEESGGGVLLVWEDVQRKIIRLARVTEASGWQPAPSDSVQGSLPALATFTGGNVLAWEQDGRALARITGAP